MNKSDLRNFAINARLELLRRVRERAVFYGVDEKSCAAGGFVPSDRFQRPDGAPLSAVEIAQRDALLRRVLERGYAQTMEEAAYTWFNRFAALRYMQAHNRLPISVRVLPDAPGEAPQLLREAQDLELPGADMGRVLDMLSASDADGLYKYLLIALCNALSESLPGMFEQISDATELLFPDGLLRADSVLGEMAKLDADSWNEIQVVGWLYQYYNTQLKDETFELLRKNVKITRDRIGPATQLFTPEWIVNYMVENSLGRLWLEGHPDANLRMKWRYYMDEAEQAPEVAAKLAEIRRERSRIQPEQIRVLDPCMGSGHILVYAFDVLMEIYRSVGYTDRDAARSIVENNLYGMDIDDRAAQLAYFAVMMKACEYDRRFLKRGVQPHVCAIRESAALTREQLNTLGTERTLAERLLRCFADAKEYGSILHADFTPEELNRLDARLAEMEGNGGNLLDMADRAAAHAAVAPLMEQARILARKYDAVITNPPYMGASGMNEKLSRFVKDNYPDSKSDLFAVFMERCGEMLNQTGYQAMITQHAWMFLSSYEKLRGKLQARELVSMAHLGQRAFEDIGGEVVQTTAFVLQRNHTEGYRGHYARLIEPTTQDGKEEMFLAGTNRYIAQQENFKKIPGMPVAYWVSDSFRSIFAHTIDEVAEIKKGSDTGDNDLYVRYWDEVEFGKISIKGHDKKWIPYLKGGEARKWYGHLTFIVNWENDGYSIRHNSKATIRNEKYFYRDGITWSDVGSNASTFRYFPKDVLRDNRGPAIFAGDKQLYVLAFLNSVVATASQRIVNPTICFQAGSVKNMPFIYREKDEVKRIDFTTEECISLSCTDWDSFETSWDFQRHPLLQYAILSPQQIAEEERNGYLVLNTMEEAYRYWKQAADERFQQLKANEEELNRIFIDIYGLQGELTPEVADRDVTVYRIIDNPNEEERKMAYVRSMRDEIVSLLSYIVGCMLGRYSPYVDGLLYAGGEWNYEAIVERIAIGAKDCDFYDSSLGLFLPDRDGIVPVTDDEYFADDVVTRTAEFVKKVYGAQTLEENLKFIADALGNKGDSPREVIRNYYLNDFYKDHLKTYQKRPIYWQFDSGKQNGFKCLMYLHRYDRDSVARVRTDYVHEQQERLRTQLDDARKTAETAEGRMRANAVKRAQKLEKQLAEVNQYEEIVHHYADMRLEIDLDDGVKVNYAKLADLLTKIK